MPIYDFTCNQCGQSFEQLCKLNWHGTVTCPACGKSKVTKGISLVSNHGRSGNSSCSGKSCSSCNGCK